MSENRRSWSLWKFCIRRNLNKVRYCSGKQIETKYDNGDQRRISLNCNYFFVNKSFTDEMRIQRNFVGKDLKKKSMFPSPKITTISRHKRVYDEHIFWISREIKLFSNWKKAPPLRHQKREFQSKTRAFFSRRHF